MAKKPLYIRSGRSTIAGVPLAGLLRVDERDSTERAEQLAVSLDRVTIKVDFRTVMPRAQDNR